MRNTTAGGTSPLNVTRPEIDPAVAVSTRFPGFAAGGGGALPPHPERNASANAPQSRSSVDRRTLGAIEEEPTWTDKKRAGAIWRRRVEEKVRRVLWPT